MANIEIRPDVAFTHDLDPYGADKYRVSRRLRKCPDDFLTQYLDPLSAIKVNFIPVMLNGLALKAAGELANQLAQARDTRLKKHTRVLRQCISQQNKLMGNDYDADKIKAYSDYVEIFAQETFSQVWLFQKNLEESAMNELPEMDRRTVSLCNYIVHLCIFARTYTAQMDRLLSDLSKMPVRSTPKMLPTMILALCMDIAETYGYRLDPTRDSKLWTEILSNKALALAERIYNEEQSSINKH